MKDGLLRVAVVDDDSSVRRALCRVLRVAEMSVEAYASAPEFLESLKRLTPDCLVLDLQMPEMTGFELQRRLQHAGIRIPTVIITAHDEPSARHRCRVAGAAAFLSKPISDDTLVTAIRDAARGPTPP